MNQSEKIAYEYLLKSGYKPTDITFYRKESPDFITSDNKGWEVKRKYGTFTTWQLLFMSLDTTIIYVDKCGKITTELFYDVYLKMYGSKRTIKHIEYLKEWNS